jgi:hypothetical protein
MTFQKPNITMTNQDVQPGDFQLEQIFGSKQPTSTSILLQNWDKCIFRADFPDTSPSLVIRLEAEDGDSEAFAIVAAMQDIARTVLLELVPQTLKVGKVKNSNGRAFHFSVIEHVEGELLQDVWEKMRKEDRISIVAEIASVAEKLQSVRIGDDEPQRLLSSVLHGSERTLVQTPGSFGGPSTGFLRSGIDFLSGILERRKLKKEFCTIILHPSHENLHGDIVVSSYKDLGAPGIIGIYKSEIEQWPEDAILCHNDLTPRNIIVKSLVNYNGTVRYKLAGIIDWELAGFYPASYELSLQDTYLSGGNRHISFYLLLKEHMAKLVPRTSSQIVLLQAMELIWESQQRCLFESHNIPANIRKRFLEIGGLVRDENPYIGWRSRENKVFEIDSVSAQKLEDDVIEAMNSGWHEEVSLNDLG